MRARPSTPPTTLPAMTPAWLPEEEEEEEEDWVIVVLLVPVVVRLVKWVVLNRFCTPGLSWRLGFCL